MFKKLKELKFTQYIPKHLDSKINLLILRDTFTENSTIGELHLNGEFMCDTLENPYINNERNISCIPEGSYSVRLRTARESATRDYLHLLVTFLIEVTYYFISVIQLKIQAVVF